MAFKSHHHDVRRIRLDTAAAVFALAALSGFAATNAHATAAVGTLAGAAGVDANGAATYNIPITLPAGTHGMHPSLALSYNSQSGEGLAGYGWNLVGLSSFERCLWTIASDGQTRAIQYTTTPGANYDDICWDGKRLRVNGSGNYGGDGTVYGTEIEGFSKVISHQGSNGSNPGWFEVYTKDGRIYEYGHTTSSKIYAQGTGNTVVRVWALDKVTDLNGNYMTYTYQQDTADGDYWPTLIDYTGNGSTTPDHEVEFDYEARPVIVAGYIHGGIVARTQRLTTIKVKYAGNATYTYTLAYQLDAANSRSQLKSVTECGADGSCLPATTIAWQSALNGWNTGTATTASTSTAAAAAAAKLMDVDGDGVMDLVYPDPTADGHWHVMFGDTNGGFTTPIVDTGISSATFYGISYALEMDYNGDGLMDLAVPIANNSDGTGRGYLVMISNGSRTTPFRTPGNNLPNLTVSSTESGSAWAVDFSASGASDFIYSDGAHTYRYPNNGSSFSPRQTIYTPPSTAPSGGGGFLSTTTTSTYSDTPFNFDGSGRGGALQLDTVVFNCIPDPEIDCTQQQNPTSYYWDALNSTESPGYTEMDSVFGSDVPPVPADVNGDGLTDLLFTTPMATGYKWELALSTGNSFTAALATNLLDLSKSGWTNADPIVADYYADGNREAIVQTGTGAWSILNVDYTAGSGFSLSTASLSDVLPSNYAAGTLRIGNIEANGLSDLVYAVVSGSTYTWHYRLHRGGAPDLVTSVTDGFGNASQFSYASLASGGSTYTKGSSAAYPAQDVQPAMQVVSSYQESDGIGGTYNLTYTYSGAQADMHGRGFLGFTQRTIQDSRSNVTDTITYNLVFPWIGAQLSDVLTRTSDGKPVRRTDNTGPDDVTYGSGYSKRYFPFFDSTAAKTYNVASGVTQTLTTVTSQHTASDFDTHGNTLSETVTTLDGATGQSFTSATAASYSSDSGTYCYGLNTGGTVSRASPSYPIAVSRLTSTPAGDVDTAHCRLDSQTVSSGQTNDGTPSLTTSYQYDSLGNLSETDISGPGLAVAHVTQYSFAGGNGEFPVATTTVVSPTISLVTHSTWDYSLGLQSSATDVNGNMTSYAYDAFGRPKRVTRPDNSQVLTNYAWCTQSTAAICPSVAVYEVTTQLKSAGGALITAGFSAYDSKGRVVRRGSVLLGGLMSVVDTTYDSAGRTMSVTAPYIQSQGNQIYVTSYQYDNAFGRLTEVDEPLDASDDCSPACLSKITLGYNLVPGIGFQTTSTKTANGLSQTTSKYTDALGETVKTEDNNSGSTLFTYDAFGDLVNTLDTNGKSTAVGFDGLGHKVSMTDPNMGSWTYAVDALGKVTCQTDAKGQSTIMAYDGISRLITKLETAPSAGCSASDGTKSYWTYDQAGALGLPASVSDSTDGSGDFTRIYSYDGLARPSDVTTTIGTGEDAKSYTVSTTYDDFGRVATVTYPASGVTPTAGNPAPATPSVSPNPASGTQGVSVTLSGSSTDTDPALQYQWTQNGGPVMLSAGAFDSAAASIIFTPPLGGVYTFELKVIESNSAQSSAQTATVNVAPLPPAGVPSLTTDTGTDTDTSSDGSVTVSWTAVAGASSYNVYQSTALNGTYTAVKTGVTGTTAPAVTGLVNGTYYFKVAAVAGGVLGDTSNASSALVVTLPPGKPTSLNVSVANVLPSTNYSVSWTAPTSGTVTKYELQEDNNSAFSSPSTFTITAPTHSKTRSQTSTGTYYYRAHACNGNLPTACSVWSNVDSVKVMNKPAAPTMDTPSPSTINDGGSSTLSWSANSSPISNYNFEGSFSSTDFSMSTPVNEGLATSTTVSPPGTKYYRVQACNVVGCGTWSNVVGVTVNFGSGFVMPQSVDPTDRPTLYAEEAPEGEAPDVDELAEIEPVDVREQVLPAVAGPKIQTSEGVVSTLQALHTRREALVANQPLQPDENTLQARFDRLNPRLPQALALDLHARPVQQQLAFAPPVYAAYAGTKHETAGGTPFRFVVQYNYDPASGALMAVSNADTGFIYWRAATDSGVAPVDAFGHVIGYVDGNNVGTVSTYDDATGAITGISAGIGQNSTVQQMTYTWDGFGNLSQRCDNNRGLTEAFTYDNLNRLATSTVHSGANVNDCTGGTTGAVMTMTYDGMGNIVTRSNTGIGINDTYTYSDSSHPYAVTGITSMTGTYSYDANGNMVSGNGRTIVWNGDNLPTSISSSSTKNGIATVTGSSTFDYSPDQQRYRQVAGSTTTLYLGGLFEVVSNGSTTQYRHNIMAGGIVVAVHSIDQLGTVRTAYLHSDSLNSIDAITDDQGQIVTDAVTQQQQVMSFDAFGMRRNPADWSYTNIQSSMLKDYTDSGFTAQEQLDGVALVHMNGRVYDPTIGRFISADPVMGGNRYDYVGNNPLSRTDASGFCWMGCFWQPNAPLKLLDNQSNLTVMLATGMTPWEHGALDHSVYEIEHNQNIQLVIAIALAVETGGASLTLMAEMGADAFWAQVAAGAVSGAVFGGTIVALNGGSPNQVLHAMLKGGENGAISAGLMYGANAVTAYSGNNFAVGVGSHAAAGGLSAVAAGGKFGKGAEFGGLAYAGQWAFQKAVNGEKPRWESGKGSVYKQDGNVADETQANNNFSGANTITDPNAPPGVQVGDAVLNPCGGCEGGTFSQIADSYPGMNAVATLHDAWGDLYQAANGGAYPMWFRLLTMPVAAAVTYGSMVTTNGIGAGIAGDQEWRRNSGDGGP
ncbi:MAG TPA: SpvB/TcaC N-terminal domain-containing protein [Gammaproteobacteria bacterium]